MRKIYLYTIIVTIGATSCQSDELKSVSGVILDATMNTMMIAEIPSGDTLMFSIMEAEKIVEKDGILIGDTAQLFYRGELITGLRKASNMAAKVIVTPVSTSPLLGSWIEPIPGMDGVQGITFERGGVASSINMSTLLYQNWELNGNTLTIKGQSVGNGQTIDFTQVATIEKLDADSLVYSVDGNTFRYSKQH